MIVIPLAILWWLTGMTGFVYWWTKDADLGTAEAIIGAMVSIVGPFSWVFGWHIHGDPAYRHWSCGRVLIKQRVPKR